MAKLYQVFVGCPFLPAIRRNYDKLKKEIEAETPLHVVLADTAAISSTDYLLEHITDLIRALHAAYSMSRAETRTCLLRSASRTPCRPSSCSP
jgi:hypothetical protein